MSFKRLFLQNVDKKLILDPNSHVYVPNLLPSAASANNYDLGDDDSMSFGHSNNDNEDNGSDRPPPVPPPPMGALGANYDDYSDYRGLYVQPPRPPPPGPEAPIYHRYPANMGHLV